MRVRVSNKPDGWRDDGPAFARSQGYGGQLVVAYTPPTKTPAEAMLARLADPKVIAEGDRKVAALEAHKRAKWREWKERSRAKRERHREGCFLLPAHRSDCRVHKPGCGRPESRHATCVVLCGHWMKIVKQPCARAVGHTLPHESRRTMDRHARMRRTRMAA